jgi:NADH-quinone oxidoreductase subunit A
VRTVQFDFAMVLVFAVSAIGFGATNLLIGALIRPHFPNAEKTMTYECGERPIGGAWINFNPRFYIIALVFVIFEVEIALTIPVALVYREWVAKHAGGLALAEILAFIGILAAGLVWIWARRDLEWVKSIPAEESAVASSPAESARRAA